MDDISKPQIARLVLGYLKQGNYKIAYNSFYKHCPYFVKSRQRKQKVSTRYNGLALEDILLQYFEINTIVQPRLEDTDFYEDRSFHYQELPQHLIYLLDNAKNKNKTNSPNRSPFTQSEMEADGNDYLSSIDTSTNINVSATTLKTLPGNAIDTAGSAYTRPRRSGNHTLTKSHPFKPPIDTETERDESSSGELDQSNQIEEVVKAFSDSLLADEQLQETIAHNINQVRAAETKQLSQSSTELETAIKSIINKTQTDPAFEVLFGELLGVAPPTVENTDNDEVAKTLPNTSQTIETQTSPVLTQAIPTNSSVQTTQTNAMCNPDNLIVIEGSNHYSNQPNQQVSSTSTNNVVLFKSPDGSTLGLPNVTVQNYIDPNKPILYIGPPQHLMNPNPPVSSEYIMQNNLSEQDILSMPTVILYDGNADEITRIESPAQLSENRVKTLMPVMRKAAENITDYITMYKCESEMVSGAASSDQPQNIETTAIVPAKPTVSVPQDKEARTPEQPKVNKAPNPTPRSGNRSSHVRALDFKFQTPAKEFSTVTATRSTSPMNSKPHKTPKTLNKTSKSLFTASSTPKEPWDMKFRNSIAAAASMAADPPVVTPEIDKLKKEEEGEENEAKETSPNENIDSTNSNTQSKSKSSKSKSKKKRTSSPRKAKRSSPKKKSKSSSKAKKAVKTNETTPVSNKSSKSKVANVEVKEEKETTVGENCISLINLNKIVKPRKQCNIESNRDFRTAALQREIKVTKVLSPSKLNGNKRSLELEVSSLPVLETPEIKKEPTAIPPSSTARRNIIPILQTPGKDIYPATPGAYSPASVNDTPFTKVFKEQMTGVDISSIPTPKIILTPTFPFTPFLEGHQSPASNRPTDYSTSSSYYQPSDTEQNHSLEKLIRECNRLEQEAQLPPPVPSEAPNPQVVEKLKRLGGNVIAKKNLNLMKDEHSVVRHDLDMTNSSCSSDGSGSSSLNSDSNKSFEPDWQDETVVENKLDGSAGRCPLRLKHSTVDAEVVTETVSEDKDRDDAIVTSVSVVDKDEISNIIKTAAAGMSELSKQCETDDKKLRILQDMEEKRKRMIERCKNDTNSFDKKGRCKLPPKKRATITVTPSRRILRSNSVKVNEVDFHVTSSDDDDDNEEEIDKKMPLNSDSNKHLDINEVEENVSVPKEIANAITVVAEIHNDCSQMKEEKEHQNDGSSLGQVSQSEKAPSKSIKSSKKSTTSTKKPSNSIKTSASKLKTNTSKIPRSKVSSKSKSDNSRKIKRDSEQEKRLVIELEKCVQVFAQEKIDELSLASEMITVDKAMNNKSASEIKNEKKLAPACESFKTNKAAQPSSRKVSDTRVKQYKKTTTVKQAMSKTANAKAILSKNDNVKKVISKNDNTKEVLTDKEKTNENQDNCTFTILKEQPSQMINIESSEERKSSVFDENDICEDLELIVSEEYLDSLDGDLSKQPKGSTGEEAVNLIVGLKERGIYLMPNPDLPVVYHPDIELISDDSDHSANKYPKFFIQKEEKLGPCIASINTPESELVELDFRVVTEPLLVQRSEENIQSKKMPPRDLEDDKFRLTKVYKMSVYDDTSDGEIVKVMKVTPFDCIFEYITKECFEPVKLNKIKVLDNVIIPKQSFPSANTLRILSNKHKRATPLQKLYKSLADDNSEVDEQPMMMAKSPLDNLYKTEPKGNKYKRNSKRPSIEKVVKSLQESKKQSVNMSASSQQLDFKRNDSQARTYDSNQERKADNDSTQDKKRKANNTMSGDTESKKKKIDDHQQLLKNINVDDVLQQIYG